MPNGVACIAKAANITAIAISDFLKFMRIKDIQKMSRCMQAGFQARDFTMDLLLIFAILRF
jgi:hypothetical protein